VSDKAISRDIIASETNGNVRARWFRMTHKYVARILFRPRDSYAPTTQHPRPLTDVRRVSLVFRRSEAEFASERFLERRSRTGATAVEISRVVEITRERA